ncbi:hypothetical protein [Micromonospora aurantiaca (nom. illeg.)]|uniref:hypothetical protein n=1 Tax=Micromonospora aurantiaca (nom. illeg.) TaxID=47850 RepID=UPI0034311581
MTIVGDELSVTVQDLLALHPPARPTTRQHVATTAIGEAGGDTGVLWMGLVDHDRR